MVQIQIWILGERCLVWTLVRKEKLWPFCLKWSKICNHDLISLESYELHYIFKASIIGEVGITSSVCTDHDPIEDHPISITQVHIFLYYLSWYGGQLIQKLVVHRAFTVHVNDLGPEAYLMITVLISFYRQIQSCWYMLVFSQNNLFYLLKKIQ